MKFERVDDKTVKCFLSNDELKEYDIDYKDFLTRSDKAREVIHEIIRQASEEVGYKPPKFAFDLQIMMVPEQGLVLTFSEKDPLDGKDGSQLMEYLREMKRALDQSVGIQDGQKAVQAIPESEEEKPQAAVFEFEHVSEVLALSKAVPGKLRVKSMLFEMDGKFYLYLHRGKASYEKYSKVCIQAMEFGEVYGAGEDNIAYVMEHADCLIEKHALRKLRLSR